MSKGLKTVLTIGGIVAGVILIVSLLSGAFWGWQGYGYGMMWPGMMGGLGSMFLMPVLWLAVVGVIVWAVAGAVRRSGESSRSGGSSDSPLEILKRRYASGELTKEEFDARKRDLV